MRGRVQAEGLPPNPSSLMSLEPLGWGDSGRKGSRGWETAGSPSTCRERQGPPPLCTPLSAPPGSTCYLLYKYFLNYQRILVSTFCAWLVSRSEGDRDRMKSKRRDRERQRERPRREGGRWRDRQTDSDRMPETKQDRQMGRESRTEVSGPRAEWSGSQEP